MSRAWVAVMAIIVLSLFASTLHVVDAALSSAALDLSASPALAEPSAQGDDQATARDASLVVDMTPGAVDAIAL